MCMCRVLLFKEDLLPNKLINDEIDIVSLLHELIIDGVLAGLIAQKLNNILFHLFDNTTQFPQFISALFEAIKNKH